MIIAFVFDFYEDLIPICRFEAQNKHELIFQLNAKDCHVVAQDYFPLFSLEIMQLSNFIIILISSFGAGLLAYFLCFISKNFTNDASYNKFNNEIVFCHEPLPSSIIPVNDQIE